MFYVKVFSYNKNKPKQTIMQTPNTQPLIKNGKRLTRRFLGSLFPKKKLILLCLLMVDLQLRLLSNKKPR